MHAVQLTITSRYVVMIQVSHNYHYKVTVNHVTLTPMGKIYDIFVKNLTFGHLVMGFEVPRIGTPHYQMYISDTPYSNFEEIRDIIIRSIKELHEVGVIDCPHATCVAFPVKVDNSSDNEVLTYCKKDGMYIHNGDGIVECRANDILAIWKEPDQFYSGPFNYFRENNHTMPNTLWSARTWKRKK